MPKKTGVCINVGGKCPKALSREIQTVDATEFLCEHCHKPLKEKSEKASPKKGKIAIVAAAAAAVLAITAVVLILIFKGKDKPEPEIEVEDVAERVLGTYELSWGLYSGPLDMEGGIPDGDGGSVLVSEQMSLETDGEQLSVTPKDTLVNCIFEKGRFISGERRAYRKPVEKSTPAKSSSGKTSGTLTLSYGIYKGEILNGYPHGMGRLTYTRSRVMNRYDTEKREAAAGDYVIGEFDRGFLVHGKHYNSSNELIEALMIGVPVGKIYEQK